jgi:hypothetical protein
LRSLWWDIEWEKGLRSGDGNVGREVLSVWVENEWVLGFGFNVCG